MMYKRRRTYTPNTRRRLVRSLRGKGLYRGFYTRAGAIAGGILGSTTGYALGGGALGAARGAHYGAQIGAVAGYNYDKKRMQADDKSLIRSLTGQGTYKKYGSKKYSTNSTMKARSFRTKGGIGPVKFRPPIIHSKRSASDIGGITITNKEYVGDIISNGTGHWEIQKFEINPGLRATFQRLGQLAANYSEYKFHSLAFTYESVVNVQSNETQTGTIMMAPQYRTDQPLWKNKREMLEATGCVSNLINKNLFCGIECNPNKLASNKILYVRETKLKEDEDLNDYDSSYLAVALNGVKTDGQIGELWVTYSVTLSKNKVSTSTIRESTFFGLGTGISQTHPLSLTPYGNKENNVDCSIIVDGNNQYIQFSDSLQGTYEIRASATINHTFQEDVASALSLVPIPTPSMAYLNEYSQKWNTHDKGAEYTHPSAGQTTNSIMTEGDRETHSTVIKMHFYGNVAATGERKIKIAFQHEITSFDRNVVEVYIKETKPRGSFMTTNGVNTSKYEKLDVINTNAMEF